MISAVNGQSICNQPFRTGLLLFHNVLNFVLEQAVPNETEFWLSDINSDQLMNILEKHLIGMVLLEHQLIHLEEVDYAIC